MLPINRKRKHSEISQSDGPPENEFIHYFNYFNRFLHLDNNLIGVVYSFIPDELNFLLYLRENKIKPYFNPICWDNIDFNIVSNKINILDDDFINEFMDRLDWNIITTLQICNQEFLEKYNENIVFSIIDNKMNFDDSLDYNFFLKHKNKLNWTKISQWDYIAEDFIDIFHIELNWVILSRQQGLTRYLLGKYIDKLVLNELERNVNINIELKTEIIKRRTQIELDNLIEENNNEENNNEDENNEDENNNEDSDLDIDNQHDSDEFFRNIDSIVSPITPNITPVLNRIDLIVDILDMDRVD